MTHVHISIGGNKLKTHKDNKETDFKQKYENKTISIKMENKCWSGNMIHNIKEKNKTDTKQKVLFFFLGPQKDFDISVPCSPLFYNLSTYKYGAPKFLKGDHFSTCEKQITCFRRFSNAQVFFW